MKFKPEKENVPLYVFSVAIGIVIIIVVGQTAAMTIAYLTGHEITVTDLTADRSSMYIPTASQKRIQTGQISLTVSDFDLIYSSDLTIPITAELARQFVGNDVSQYFDYRNNSRYAKNAYLDMMNTGKDGYRKTCLLFTDEPPETKKDLTDFAKFTFESQPIALDCIAFITHKDNPVDSITAEQARKIYSGKITNWKKVGGKNQKIIFYQRGGLYRGSSLYETMSGLVMNDAPMVESPESYYAYKQDKGGGFSRHHYIAEYENRTNSIGYANLYYINTLYNREDIKVLKIDGVSPDNENLISGAYPFTDTYYAVTIDSDDENFLKMRELRDYLLTDEGQSIIEMSGLCPVRSLEG